MKFYKMQIHLKCLCVYNFLLPIHNSRSAIVGIRSGTDHEGPFDEALSQHPFQLQEYFKAKGKKDVLKKMPIASNENTKWFNEAFMKTFYQWNSPTVRYLSLLGKALMMTRE